jgi:hypothetical protein
MPTLTRWYERRAKDCVQAAGRTDNPKHREHLLTSGRAASIAAIEAAEIRSGAERVRRGGRPG